GWWPPPRATPAPAATAAPWEPGLVGARPPMGRPPVAVPPPVVAAAALAPPIVGRPAALAAWTPLNNVRDAGSGRSASALSARRCLRWNASQRAQDGHAPPCSTDPPRPPRARAPPLRPTPPPS